MTNAKQVIDYLETFCPKNTALEFDNVGLLVGRNNHKVKKIMVMLDADNETIQEAIDNKVDMIITHHPLLLSPISRVNDELILSLIENGICLYSAHTNLDQCKNGVNENLIKILGGKKIKRVLLPTDNFYTYTGYLPEMTLKETVNYVKNKLSITNLRYAGNDDSKVKSICVISGSGCSMVDDVKNLGCDTLITADVKYHQAQYANSIGLNIIDAGHFETENIICNVIKEMLEKQFDDLEILISKRKNSYIKYG
ncbi:MAG: Nif3-like dinuclear metal center hexameric protein [Clostridia bacterium]|nr:Nif3-like dinuclear metal center hexameric protein [Clostridia bacterium]